MGWAKDLTAQLLFDDAWCLVNSGRHANMNDALAHVWALYVGQICMMPGKKASLFTLGTIGLSQNQSVYPCLAATIKGAASKQLFRWATDRCMGIGLQATASQYQKHLAYMCAHFVSYVQICSPGGLFLTEEDTYRACCHGWEFLRWWQYMAEDAFNAGRCAFKLRPKLHNLGHELLALAHTRENPAKHALWGAEDMVGQIVRVGGKCHRRTAPVRVTQRRGIMFVIRSRNALKARRVTSRQVRLKSSLTS